MHLLGWHQRVPFLYYYEKGWVLMQKMKWQ